MTKKNPCVAHITGRAIVKYNQYDWQTRTYSERIIERKELDEWRFYKSLGIARSATKNIVGTNGQNVVKYYDVKFYELDFENFRILEKEQ